MTMADDDMDALDRFMRRDLANDAVVWGDHGNVVVFYDRALTEAEFEEVADAMRLHQTAQQIADEG